MCNTSDIIFCETADEAAKSCESAVDIIDASMPDKTTPAITDARIPCCAKIIERRIIVVSLSAEFVKKGIAPATEQL